MGILSWLKRRRRELDLDEEDFQAEIRAHLAIATDEKLSDGVDRRGRALRGAEGIRQRHADDRSHARRVWTPRWLGGLRDLSSDVRYAIRALAKNRGFSLTVIGVLTLGIGLNATVFTMLKGMALTPLAGVEAAASLSRPLSARPSTGRVIRISYPDYQYIRDHDSAFSGSDGLGLHRPQRRPRAKRPPGVGRAGHRQLLSGPRRPRAARPHAAAVGRGRTGPASGRRAQRRHVAARLRRRPRASSARRSTSTTTR